MRVRERFLDLKRWITENAFGTVGRIIFWPFFLAPDDEFGVNVARSAFTLGLTVPLASPFAIVGFLYWPTNLSYIDPVDEPRERA